VCSRYKSGRGTCSAHHIRKDVLKELVLERIRAVNAYIREDAESFAEEWLAYRQTEQDNRIREYRRKLDKAEKRLAELDVLISRVYEDAVFGRLSNERYLKMTQDYEAEQKRVRMEADNLREWIGQHEKATDDLSHFMKLVEKYVDVPELTQTIVNEYIRKIIVHAPDKSSGKRRQKIQIIFNFMEDDELLSLNEPVVALSTHKKRETA